ncbi:MAG: hypothetical protein AB1632_10700 [Nitrospirota bacterium]
MRKSIIISLIFIVCFSAITSAGPQRVTDPQSKHNLSIYSALTVKSTTEREICIFCHTPHNSSPEAPLWNHDITTATYTYYWSPSMNAYSSVASAPPVDGYSKLCLSCHDGTVALGAVRSRTTDIQMQPVAGIVSAEGKLIGGPGYVGTDLSGAHPISFVFDAALAAADGNLKWPINDTDVRLDANSKVQCTACHDPHDDSRANDPFNPNLRFWNKTTHDEVCNVCHNI